MLSKTLMKGFDKGQLRRLLAFFFMALAIPTGALIWQAYSQLKWEAFHQYRGMAEELTNRIDNRPDRQGSTSAEARSFADYTFLVVSGDPSANFIQRSPLSELPVTAGPARGNGLLPGRHRRGILDAAACAKPFAEPASFRHRCDGIRSKADSVPTEIQAILSDNRLVQNQPTGSETRTRLIYPLPRQPVPNLKPEAEEEERWRGTGNDRQPVSMRDSATNQPATRISWTDSTPCPGNRPRNQTRSTARRSSMN